MNGKGVDMIGRRRKNSCKDMVVYLCRVYVCGGLGCYWTKEEEEVGGGEGGLESVVGGFRCCMRREKKGLEKGLMVWLVKEK